MNENNLRTGSILQGIIDIAPPAQPATTDLGLVVAAVITLIAMLILIAVYAHKYLGKRGKAARKLKRLQRELKTAVNIVENNHDTAFQIANILQNGLDINRVNSNIALPSSLQYKQKNWQNFVINLSHARYSIHASSKDELEQLIIDARYWLRCWP